MCAERVSCGKGLQYVFTLQIFWNRKKCLHEKESDTSLLKRQDLPSVMAKRLEWDRLIKSVRVRPK